MRQERELQFAVTLLERMRVKVAFYRESDTVGADADLGLRAFLGRHGDYDRFFGRSIREARPNTIYRFTDSFLCQYVCLRLPEEAARVMLIGPYMAFAYSRRQLLEEAERLGVPPHSVHRLEQVYGAIPVLQDGGPLVTVLNVLAETLWGGADCYRTVDTEESREEVPVTFDGGEIRSSEEELLLSMKMMEQRYAYENKMMQAISEGLSHKVEMLLTGVSEAVLEERAADPIRNLKNYCIIMNTLARKAAEQGGVHPVYLDMTSADFARRIEAVNTVEAGRRLMEKMFVDYCRLVRKHRTSNYSAPVQRTVIRIQADLGGELSLSGLAGLLGVHPAYLSGLFKRETGMNITDFIQQKRMEQAVRLLRTTKLQVQTIAQHCGIPDANYFTKCFKKQFGVTPNAFRREQARR